jgi:LysR family glycine cleavage system transcriptional activator
MTEEVLPVASPALLAGRRRWTPRDLATLPLLQQSTRPEAWRQWFDAMGVAAPQALQGPRYELFSMLAVAASHGMGAALVPRMLVEDELRRGELAVVCERPLRGQRGYYFVTPDSDDERPAVGKLRQWLLAQSAAGRAP